MSDVLIWLLTGYGVVALLVACFVIFSQVRRWQTVVEGGLVGALWLPIVVGVVVYIVWLNSTENQKCQRQ